MLRVAIVDDEVEQQDLLEQDLHRYEQEQGRTLSDLPLFRRAGISRAGFPGV